MFDHISLTARDFRKSLHFYRVALGPLGYEAQHVDEEGKSAGFAPKGEVAFGIAAGAAGSSVHGLQEPASFQMPRSSSMLLYVRAARTTENLASVLTT